MFINNATLELYNTVDEVDTVVLVDQLTFVFEGY